MSDATQANRFLKVSSPLGDDVLLIERFSATEDMSSLYGIQVEMVAELKKADQVDPDKLLGKWMTVSVELGEGKEARHFNGICSRFSEGGRDTRFATYHAEVVPWMWLMRLDSDCRIFQDKTIKDILTEIFDEWSGKFPGIVDYDIDLRGQHKKLDYCVQYRETDFNFVSRLMEQEGLFYYFVHHEKTHTLMISDDPAAHNPCPHTPEPRYAPDAGHKHGEEVVTTWEWRRSIVPGSYVQRDYQFQMSNKTLEATEKATAKVGGNDKLELYDYPGEYAQRFNQPDKRMGELDGVGTELTKQRMYGREAGHRIISGTSTCRSFSPGFRIGLTGADGKPIKVPGTDGQYVFTSVRHVAEQSPDYVSGRASGEPYRNSFTCIPHETNFRSAESTPKPVVQGLQTAVVVGEKGEEISVDKYGRIKVQFHWDRIGKKDENSSCWVRVGQAAAGTKWGGFFWPRIGHEVLVAFLEGDPDAPIVVGSVYNYENMPPYTLPDNKTRSGFKTRSTLKGNDQHFNELRFEDKKGSEEIYVHAERDMNRVVENNDTVKIGFSDKDKGDQTTEIFNNQTYVVGSEGCEQGDQVFGVWNDQHVTIGGGETQAASGNQLMQVWNNQELTVGFGAGANADGSQTVKIWKDRNVTIQTGNDTLSIQQGNMSVTLDMGNQDTQLKMGNQSTTLDMGNLSTTLKMGNQTTKLNLGASSTEAMQSIELKVGQSSIKVDQMGVTIKGMMIKIDGTMMTDVKGMMTKVNGSAMLTAKGGITMIN